MLINFNHIKTLYSALVQKMKGFCGNWEQNDPTADDYIKNRTHYVEIGEAVILPLTTLTSGEVQLQQPLVKGQTYSIIWDGVTYESVAREYDGYLMLGNNAIYDYDNGIETDTGEPFALETEIGYNNAYIYSPVVPRMLGSDGSEITQHTISITTYGEIVHKLDKKFIDMPDGIVTEDSLPAILEDTLAPVSFTNSYDSLSGKPTVYTDVVRYRANQSLTTSQKTVARNNIGAASSSNLNDLTNNSAVRYNVVQSLTNAQKKQARTNIGAISSSDLSEYVKYTEQTLTDEQKAQARENIGAVNFSGSYNDLVDKPTYMILKDIGNSLDYVVQLKDGALILTSKAVDMEITTMPNKTEYFEGEDNTLDLTGMVVTIHREDGSDEIITNYTYTETRTDSNITVVIEYAEFDEIFSKTLIFPITPFDPEVQLVDFEYTAESNGTYTLTGWKGTLNGETSTELIIPDNSLINL